MVVVPTATSVATPLVPLTVAMATLLLEYVMAPVPPPPVAALVTVLPATPETGPACAKAIVCGCGGGGGAGVLPPPPPPPHPVTSTAQRIATNDAVRPPDITRLTRTPTLLRLTVVAQPTLAYHRCEISFTRSP